MTLSSVSVAYYRHVMKYGLSRFARFARVVWDIPAEGKSEEQLASEGIDALADWIKKIGAASEISSLGVTPEMIDGIADATIIFDAGYKKLTPDEIKEILRHSL
jgi:alcohol dehydrogenase YqhD (iron-dependent ADH family)